MRQPTATRSVFAEAAASGEEARVVCQYVWGARPGHRDELILRDRVTTPAGSSESSEGVTEFDERLWCLMDYYDPTAIVDIEGEVVERYRFSAFGLRTILDPDFDPRAESDFGWDFAFKGQFLDLESGYYNYGYRYYSPELGRWLSRDPIGERGGVNVYAMAKNNVINRLDLNGLSTEPVDFALVPLAEGIRVTLIAASDWNSVKQRARTEAANSITLARSAISQGSVSGGSYQFNASFLDEVGKLSRPGNTAIFPSAATLGNSLSGLLDIYAYIKWVGSEEAEQFRQFNIALYNFDVLQNLDTCRDVCYKGDSYIRAIPAGFVSQLYATFFWGRCITCCYKNY
jgi:RHS repeat-associated protein